ncbi:MAG: RNA polymerase sigma-70 factor, partial [Candidatus Atribacteria bacterium]|nr:RNA polymerase sigma-70 factor [Candidatus Atribacteria bacterium]
LESTYINYYTYLVRIARLYVGSKAEAEDIVQDVFMHVWIKLNLNKSSQPIDIENVNYLVIAVKNKCFDFLRLKKRLYNVSCSRQDEYDLLFDRVNFYEPDEDNSTMKTDIENSISHAINNLPEKCRQIFIEKKIKGEKQKNIAQRYNVSVKTIEKQMTIAYKKLRTELYYLV